MVSRVFECTSVDGPTPVTLANGDRKEKGFIVRAKPGTVRKPAMGLRIQAKWRVIGQFLYFDDNWKRFDVTGHRGDDNYLADSVHEGSVSAGAERLTSRPYKVGMAGTDRKQPEAVLVEQYVRWMGGANRWEDLKLLPDERLFCDLFDRSRWRLIEAKATTDRKHFGVRSGN